jgi:hypothetical protein
MRIPPPAPVKMFKTRRTEDGQYISLVFECHDGKAHSVMVPYQTLEEIMASLARAGKEAAKARGEREH